MPARTVRAIFAAAALLGTVVLCGGAAEAKRVALVIGNQQYEQLPSLEKSAADAASFADLFKTKSFDKVIFRQNLTRTGMDEAVSEFVEALAPGDTAVFFYAGHGWSDGSQNFLVPTDAPREGSQDFLKRISLPIANGATGVLDAVEQKGATLKVAIIDACRDNPFTAANGTRSIGLSRGFNRMPEPPSGTFVVFSAGAGQTALDRLSDGDPDPNGVFTRTFLPLLRADLTLLDATKKAQDKVYELAKAVDHDQQPAFYDETRGNNACLSGTCTEAAPPGTGLTATPLPPDQAAWLQIASTSDPSALQSFITTWPTSAFGPAAQQKLDEITVAGLQLTPLDEPVWTTGAAILRSGPGPLFQGIGNLREDTMVTALGQIAGLAEKGSSSNEWWIKARTKQGTGFISRDLLVRDWAKQDQAAYEESVDSLHAKFAGSAGSFAKNAGLYEFGAPDCTIDVRPDTLFGFVAFWFDGNTAYQIGLRPLADGSRPVNESAYVGVSSQLTFYRKLNLTDGQYNYYRTTYGDAFSIIGFNRGIFQSDLVQNGTRYTWDQWFKCNYDAVAYKIIDAGKAAIRDHQWDDLKPTGNVSAK